MAPRAARLALVPPHSTQAEAAVVGSVLKNGLAIADGLTFLKPHHFYERRHEYMFAAMAALFEEQRGHGSGAPTH